MFIEKYKGLRIAVTDSAMRELMKEEKTLYDIVEILEKGYDAPRKRKKGTIEKWFDKGNKTFNAVIVKDYDEMMKENCWALIHFGKFTRRK
jgi:hypothetical protein